MGLWIYQECRRYWSSKGEDISFKEMDKMILDSKQLECFINTDDIRFFKTGNMPKKVQEFCNETGQNVPETKGQIVRCIMESLALTYRFVIENLEKTIGYPLPIVHIVGGGCVDEILCQFTSNASGKFVEAGPIEATATGNLLAQLIGLGEISSLRDGREIVRNSFEFKSYEPKEKSIWDKAYINFKKIIEEV
jgi:rhamnulokinase